MIRTTTILLRRHTQKPEQATFFRGFKEPHIQLALAAIYAAGSFFIIKDALAR